MSPSSTTTSLLRVRLGDALLGLPASSVREIVRAVAITPLAGAPSIIEGAVNVRGAVVPVLDVRRRLSLPAVPLDPDQFLVVLDTGDRIVAMRVDEVDDLVDVVTDSVAQPAQLSPALRALAGLSAGPDGVIVVYDPASFISQAETESLDRALAVAG